MDVMMVVSLGPKSVVQSVVLKVEKMVVDWVDL